MCERETDDPDSLVGRLYDSYGASLYRYAVMLLADTAAAEDAVQQVFAALLKPGAAVLRNELHYLRRAVRNECYSMVRARRTGLVLTGSLLEPRSSDGSPEERLALEAAMVHLTPEQREVVHLHAFEGLTFQEVADATSESINTIASRYRYALARLREVLSA